MARVSSDKHIQYISININLVSGNYTTSKEKIQLTHDKTKFSKKYSKQMSLRNEVTWKSNY